MNSMKRAAVYAALKREYPKQYISFGALRSETDLTGTLQSVSFQWLENQGTPRATEQRLGQNDAFVVLEHMFFLRPSADTAAGRAAGKLYTAPNPAVFTAAVAGRYEAIYNGGDAWTLNAVNIVPYLDAQGFRRVAFPQELVATTADAGKPPGSIAYWLNDYADNMNYLDMDEPLIFGGTSNVVNTIDWGVGVDLTPGSGVITAVKVLRGFLIQNVGASFKKEDSGFLKMS
jgi:hypothetical protein